MVKNKKRHRKHAFSYDGYKEWHVEKEIVKEKTKQITKGIIQKLKFWEKADNKPAIQESFVIRAGPIKGGQDNEFPLLPGVNPSTLTPEMSKFIENNWMPEPKLSVYDNTNNVALTAAVAEDRRVKDKRWMPQYYQNPMQGYDYLVYESLLKNTILGPLAWSLVKFILGTNFEPALELLNPSNDKKKDQKIIKDHEYIINNLKYIDRCMSNKSDEAGIDITFKSKITNMIHNMLFFNRSCAVYTFDDEHPIELNPKGNEKGEKKKYPDIPTGLVDFHPRDMGIAKISPDSHKMVSLQISQISGFVEWDSMLYMWNSQSAAPIYNAKFYGGSLLMPCIEPARFVRTQVSSILPAVAENMAGGLYHIFIEPEGGTEAQKQTEYESIVKAAQFGTANVFMIAPDRVTYENVNFDPKIGELIVAFDTQIKYIIACFSLPQIGSYDEAAANHATAVEKIQLTISTAINPLREWIGPQIEPWYNANFMHIYKDDEESKLFRIKIDFEDLQVETLKERTESIQTLKDAGIKLDGEKLEEILRIEDLEEHMEEIEEDQGMPSGPKNFNVKDKKTGGKFSVRTS